MMIKYLLTSAIMPIAGVAGCQGTGEPPVPYPIDDRPAQVIYIGEDYNATFNAEAGDTIIQVMTDDGGQLDRCDNSGGTLHYNAYTWIYTCEGIDF